MISHEETGMAGENQKWKKEPRDMKLNLQPLGCLPGPQCCQLLQEVSFLWKAFTHLLGQPGLRCVPAEHSVSV